MTKPLQYVAITGAAGQIAYQLIFRIASGEMLGKDQPIGLRLLDVPEALTALEGVKMELEDCAYPLLKDIQIGSDPIELFDQIDLAILVGAKPRGPGMERKDLLLDNAKIFITQGKALDQVAKDTVQVVVVGNPCNTNCLIAIKQCKRLSYKQFHCLTRLDQNRATSLLAQKASVPLETVTKVTIWGNHSTTQVPDFINARIQEKPVRDLIQDETWLKNDFLSLVQKRGAAIIAARGKSSAASAANAIIDHVKSLYTKSEPNHWFSMGFYSKGNPYGIDEDLVFSFPCQALGNGQFSIVPHLELTPFLKEKLQVTSAELIEERTLVGNLLAC